MGMSRIENILENLLGGQNELKPPMSRIETLLYAILDQGIGGGIEVVVLTQGQYDSTTKMPTITGAQENVFYLTPGEDLTGNFYNEWILVNGNWELFGRSKAEYVDGSDISY